MSGDSLRTANILGAAVLALSDSLRHAVQDRTGRSGEGPAAVIALGHQPGLTNDGLSRLLGLTHTGVVRLIDRLVQDGLVDRRSSSVDRRAIALHLTKKGEAMRRQILKAREEVLLALINQLSDRQQVALAAALGTILRSVAEDDAHKLRICRLCDAHACRNCPIHVPVSLAALA